MVARSSARLSRVPAAAPDSYSPVQASRVLGVSEKRVRQLVDAGRLDAVGTAPLRVGQESVHRLREERKAKPGATSTTAAGRSTGVDVEAIVTRTVEALLPRALESAENAQRRLEDTLREQLAAERARADTAELKLRELTGRRWWRGRV